MESRNFHRSSVFFIVLAAFFITGCVTLQDYEERAARVDSRIAQIDSRYEERAARVDSRFAQIDSRYEQRTARVDSYSEIRAAQVDGRIAQIDNRFEDRAARVDNRYEERAALEDSRHEARDVLVDSRYEERAARVDSRFAQIDSRYEERAARVDSRFAQIESRYEQPAARIDSRYEDRVARVDMQIEHRAAQVEWDIKDQLCKVDLTIEVYDVDNQSFIDEVAEILSAQAEMKDGFVTLSIVKDWSEFEDQMIAQRIKEVANDFNLSVAWNKDDSPSLCSINSDGTFTYLSLTGSVMATETSRVDIMLEGTVLEGSMVYIGIDNNFLLALVESNVFSVDVETDGTWTTRIQGEIEPGNAIFPAKIYTMVTRKKEIKGHESEVVLYSEFEIMGLSGQYEKDTLIPLDDSIARTACPPSRIPDALQTAFENELGACK